MRKFLVIIMVCFIFVGAVGISGCIGGDQENNETNDNTQSSNDDSNGNSGSDDNNGGSQSGQSNVNV